MTFHHGVSSREPSSGAVYIRETATGVIGLIAFADDADPDFYPFNTPVLITSMNLGISKAGYEGNLRRSLETIQAIVNPTVVVVRIPNPFSPLIGDNINGNLNDSEVIGSITPNGQRTGIQALLTAKSRLNVVPKITIAPDVETPSVVQALIAVNKKLRAFSYVSPRDDNGFLLETKEDVVAYRDTLGAREIMLIYPEFLSGNVLLGADSVGGVTPPAIIISCAGAIDHIHFENLVGQWDLEINGMTLDTTGSNSLKSYIQSSIPNSLEVNGVANQLSIRNLEPEALKVRLIPRLNVGFSIPNDNSTFLIQEDGSLTFCLSPVVPVDDCEPTIWPMLDEIIPTSDNYKISYRINGGEILTRTEGVSVGNTGHAVMLNVLGYYGLFNDLVSTGSGQKAFLAVYDQPFQGASINHPNFIRAESNTIEFLLTSDTAPEDDLIATIFGESVALHSCAIVNWNT